MPIFYDAVIVGAGPAGLAASIVLARNGLHVLVCDQHRLPIDKPCGEGLLPPGLRHLQALGVMSFLDPAETYPFQGIRIRTSSGRTAEAPFLEGPGLGIRRVSLSLALGQAALQWRNLEILEAPVRGVSRAAEGMEVHLRDRTVKTRLVIGADGLNSQVRRWAGLEGVNGRTRRLGARQHFAIPPWSDYVEVRHGAAIEVYVTPCGNNTIGVAFLWDMARYGSARGGPQMIPSLLRMFPEIDERLRGVPTSSQSRGIGPLYRQAKRQIADGILLLGDAGGYLDACTGEGISLAFAQALSLEHTVVPLLKKAPKTILRRQLLPYEHAYRRIIRPYAIATRLLLSLHRHPYCFDRFILAMQRNPDILQSFYSAQMGEASFWPGWSKLFRLVRGVLV